MKISGWTDLEVFESDEMIFPYFAKKNKHMILEVATINIKPDTNADFETKLQAAQAVYPKAKVKQVTGGVMLLSSPPPIPFKGA